MNKIIGNIYKGIGRGLEVLGDILILVLSLIVEVLDNGRRIFGAFSILLFLVILNPLLLAFLLVNRWVWIFIGLFFIVPILGRRLTNFLKYGQYVVTEFFYDRSDFYLLNKNTKYKTFGEYSREYKRQQEEARRRKYEDEARRQQQYWEEMFNQYYRQRSQRSYGGYNTYNTGGAQYYNPASDFIREYEEACKTLGLSPSTDKYEIRLAYRKMAKKYHPDINKAENATEMFQKINEANSFLSDENIERYKNLKNN